MKTIIQSVAIFALLLTVLFACDSNESPTITIHELGHENSKTVAAGSDLHLDAEIKAANKIKTIQLIIHNENQHVMATVLKVKSQLNSVLPTWEIDSIYTKGYSGVKNTEFHEDIMVPSSALPGLYHVQIKVTDMEGNQAIKEDEIEVLSPKQ